MSPNHVRKYQCHSPESITSEEVSRISLGIFQEVADHWPGEKQASATRFNEPDASVELPPAGVSCSIPELNKQNVHTSSSSSSLESTPSVEESPFLNAAHNSAAATQS